MLANTWNVSRILIGLSLFFTLLSFFIPEIRLFWINNYFLAREMYFQLWAQIFISEFLHWWILHLMFNSIFILYFGSIVEQILVSSNYFIFFIVNSLFLAGIILIFGSGNTIGISWFAMATLSYYTIELWHKKNPEYTGWITAIVINVVIWLSPGISFLGHAGGAIFWVIYWWINHFLKK